LKAAVQKAVAMIFSIDNPVGNSAMVQAIRRWRIEERFNDQEEAGGVLQGLLSPMVESREAYLKKLERSWQDYSQRVRVCTFTTKTDNLQAWQTYADNHSGVALKFASGEETSFAEPRKVIYQDTRAQISDITEQLDFLFNGTNLDVSKEFVKKLLIKPKQLSHQNEFRCIRLLGKGSVGQEESADGHTLVKFSPKDLMGVYFGLNTPDATKQAITGLAKALNPKIKIFQATLDANRFELNLVRVKKDARPIAQPA
jgi:hypothetical protein